MGWDPNKVCEYRKAKHADKDARLWICMGWNCDTAGCYSKKSDQQRAKAEKAKYRVFPGPPHDGLGHGFCRWCGKEMAADVPRRKQRTWCPGGDCFHEYNLHTRLEVQRTFLFERDGLGCSKCGSQVGQWARGNWATDPDYYRGLSETWVKHFDPAIYVGEFFSVTWSADLQVDHRIPLVAAFRAFEGDRRLGWFWGPGNIWLLCPDCHREKTREDVKLGKACEANGKEWAKAEVLHMLRETGRLRIVDARPA